jgi:hypothetical protein
MSKALVFTDTLDDSSFDTTHLFRSVANGATADEGAAGVVLNCSGNVNKSAIMGFSAAVAKADGICKIDWSMPNVADGSKTFRYIHLMQKATTPAAGDGDTYSRIIAAYNPASGTGKLATSYYNASGAWVNIVAANYASAIETDTVYRTILYTTLAKWKAVITLASNEATILSDTGWQTWASLNDNGNPYWLCVGDPFSAGSWDGTNTIVRIERFGPFPVPTRYKSATTNGIFARETGLEQNVIVEDVGGVSTLRNWYSKLSYNDPDRAIGGALYGTQSYPFASHDVYYMDVPVADFLTAASAGSAIPWANQGLCVTQHGRSCVRKIGGTYHMLTWYAAYITGGTGNRIDYYTSPTGAPGSWSLVQTGVIVNPVITAEVGNNTFEHDGSEYKVLAEMGPSWNANLYTGAALTSLAPYAGNPVIPSYDGHGTSCGELQSSTIGGERIIFGHDSNTAGAVTPTEITLYAAPDVTGPWIKEDWVLHLTGYWNADPTKAYGANSQLADPSIVELDGKTFIFYEDIWNEQYDIPSLSVAWWDMSLAALIGYVFAASAGYYYQQAQRRNS